MTSASKRYMSVEYKKCCHSFGTVWLLKPSGIQCDVLMPVFVFQPYLRSFSLWTASWQSFTSEILFVRQLYVVPCNRRKFLTHLLFSSYFLNAYLDILMRKDWGKNVVQEEFTEIGSNIKVYVNTQ